MKEYTNTNIDERIKGRNIQRLSDCNGAYGKIKWLCLVDGHIWESVARNVVSKKCGCPKCKHRIKLGIIEINNILKKRNIECIGEFKNSKCITKWKCLIDGYEWETSYDSIRQGGGCHKCQNVIRYTNERVDEKLNERNIVRLSNCDGAYGKVKWKCLIDGCIWEATPADVIGCKKSGCPCCKKESKGEREIRNFLNENKINYTPQKTFDGCKKEKLLPFDFYLENINTCIEVQGIQQFKPIKYFGGEAKFDKQKIRDNIKKKFCELNNIQLVIISYKDNIIEKMKNIIKSVT